MLSSFLSSTRPNQADILDQEDIAAMRWLVGQIHDMVQVAAQSSLVCRYKTGRDRIFGHRYQDYRVYERLQIDEYTSLTLDDALYITLPNAPAEELMPGFSDNRQLHFVDNGQSLAISARQTLRGLFGGGFITPCPRDAAPA